MKFTILGASGFVGRNLAKYLTAQGYEVALAPRDVRSLEGKDLGHLIYAIGLTGDFRSRPHDTIEAHVTLLSWVLKNCKFESFLYCSSTRVYGGLPADKPASEESKLLLSPGHDSLYDLSKLLGESLCIGMNNPKVRVVRLSNVYGADQSKATFLGAVLDEALTTGAVAISENAESTKDYVSIDDVVAQMTKIILHGKHLLYNIASGKSVRCGDIAEWLNNLGYKASFSGNRAARKFPPVDITRLSEEFSFKPKNLGDDIKTLITRKI